MARERRRARSGQDENILIKALRFGTIPLIVIILIIIILCMDRPGESGSDESSASGVSSHSGQQEGGDGGSGQAAGYDEDREDPDRTEEDGSGRTVRQKTAGRTPPRRQILLSMLFSRTPYWS